MSVLIEALTLVVRKEQLDMRYPGGSTAFLEATLRLESPPRFVCCGDSHLVNLSFSDPDHLEPAAELLREQGFIDVDDGVVVDMAYVDQRYGPSMPCSWLEWKRHPDGFTYAGSPARSRATWRRTTSGPPSAPAVWSAATSATSRVVCCSWPTRTASRRGST